MKFDARALVVATGGTEIREGVAGRIETDTRKDVKGCWFLALQGANFDGHDHVQAALDAGAVGAIVHRDVDINGAGGLVRVSDTTVAFQDLARYARSRFNGCVVGLTGSSGKTTTRALTALALSPLGAVHATVGNLNNHLGVPMTVCAVQPEHRAMVVEMGTSSPGEIEVLADIGTPDIRLIVNVGASHLEELGGLDGVAVEKGALFRSARAGDTVVLNELDSRVAGIPLPDGVRTIGVGAPTSAIHVLEMAPRDGATSMFVRFATPDGETTVVLPLFGEHIALDAALALGVAWAAGVSLHDATAAMANYQPVGMRMKRIDLENGVHVLNDAYNANPLSVRASLRSLAALPGRRIAVLGDMLELGSDEDRFHAETVAFADALKLDQLVLVGERMGRAASSCSTTPCVVAMNPGEAGDQLAPLLQDGDWVLLKGSRGARTEDVLPRLGNPS